MSVRSVGGLIEQCMYVVRVRAAGRELNECAGMRECRVTFGAKEATAKPWYVSAYIYVVRARAESSGACV